MSTKKNRLISRAICPEPDCGMRIVDCGIESFGSLNIFALKTELGTINEYREKPK
jgi:hypothetical protein